MSIGNIKTGLIQASVPASDGFQKHQPSLSQDGPAPAHSFNSAALGHARLSHLANSGTSGRPRLPPPLPPRPAPIAAIAAAAATPPPLPRRQKAPYRNAHVNTANERFSLYHANDTDRREGTMMPALERQGIHRPGSAALNESRAPAATQQQEQKPSFKPRKQLKQLLQRGAAAFSTFVNGLQAAQMARTQNHAARTARQEAEQAWKQAQTVAGPAQQAKPISYKEYRGIKPVGAANRGNKVHGAAASTSATPVFRRIDMTMPRTRTEWASIVVKWHEDGMSKKDLLTLAKDFRATDAPGRLKAQDFEKKFAAQISGTVKNNQYVEDEGAMRINFTRMSAEIRGAISLGKVT